MCLILHFLTVTVHLDTIFFVVLFLVVVCFAFVVVSIIHFVCCCFWPSKLTHRLEVHSDGPLLWLV